MQRSAIKRSTRNKAEALAERIAQYYRELGGWKGKGGPQAWDAQRTQEAGWYNPGPTVLAAVNLEEAQFEAAYDAAERFHVDAAREGLYLEPCTQWLLYVYRA